MPLYQYTCLHQHTFELIKPIANRDDLVPCPHCSAPAQRILGVPHTIFKGQGWTRPSTLRKGSTDKDD